MNIRYGNTLVYFIVVFLITIPVAAARTMFDAVSPEKTEQAVQAPSILHDFDLRHAGLHDAGALYSPMTDGMISLGFSSVVYDPETGELMTSLTYPAGSGRRYVWSGAIWVGGIIGQDTIVSVGADGWFIFNFRELAPEDPARGSMYRTGNFADDEFVTTLIDTLYNSPPISTHGPLNITIHETSRSWADTAYDDFILIDYTVLNSGSDYISDGWFGIYIDNDIYHISHQVTGYTDDCSGSLDTLLDDNDPNSRVLIGYAFDNDGDPMSNSEWGRESIPGVMALVLLGSNPRFQGPNFNWWSSSGYPDYDFGPRRLGTPEDPLRYFYYDNLGTAVSDEDRYYLMSHPEVDYDVIETLIHDSSDGWVPASDSMGGVDFANGYDTRYLYSFGPFDLAPGDSVTFTMAVTAADRFHVNPRDYADYFDPLHPDIFRSHLDFSELLTHVRRADSVCRSGYLLPNPGPPAGLRIADYDESHVDMVWSPSSREDLGGYNLYIMDTTIDNIWHSVTSNPIYDTAFTVPLFNPTHVYSLAVGLFDTQRRHSLLSRPIILVPGIPHPPESLTVSIEGAFPTISWRPHEDTAIQVFMIYRRAWNDPIMLYDSTAALSYTDYGAESGIRYRYYVRTKNDLGLESDMAGPVEAIYMARDRSVLFVDFNRYSMPSPGPYLKEYSDRLYNSIAAVTSAERFDVPGQIPSLVKISHYATIVFEASNKPRADWFYEDTLALYLEGGGSAIIIVPALGYYSVLPKIQRYGPGDFYHDYFKLDSSCNPGVVFSDSGIVGDLHACNPQIPEYPTVTADPAILAQTAMPTAGEIPFAGYLFPTAEAEAIYRYVSSNPDTSSNGQINGIRYLGEDFRVVFFCFPLLPMTEEAGLIALRQALIDVGIDMDCGDANNDGRVNIGDITFMINYLYRDGPPPEIFGDADAFCDGQLGMPDILVLVNLIFKGGWLQCCH